MMRDRGLTLIELLVAMTLFGTLLSMLLSIFSTAQQSYWTNNAVIRSHEVTRMAVDEIAADLIGAKIISWRYSPRDTSNPETGIGQAYVKFQRPVPMGLTNPVFSWDETYYMYIWCFDAALAPCSTIADPKPTRSELWLVSSETGNLTDTWSLVRKVTMSLDNTLTTASVAPLPPAPFVLSILRSDGTNVSQSNESCGTGAECQAHFTADSNDESVVKTQAPVMMSVRVATRGRPGDGRVMTNDRQTLMRLRNPQF